MTIRGSTDVWPVKKGFNTFVLFTPNVTDLTVAFFGVPPLDDGCLVLRCGFGVPDSHLDTYAQLGINTVQPHSIAKLRVGVEM